MISLQKPLILASNSPRRKQLLNDAGFDFTVEVLPTDETFPITLPAEQVADYISKGKADMFRGIRPDAIVLTADTIVVADHEILGKPADRAEAFKMLEMLSGRSHTVITSVSLLSENTIQTVSDIAAVTFSALEEWEITHYIEQYKPFDKAGSYGIQEWIGMVGVQKIEGSFYTIMGLPVHIVYKLLKPYFIS
ncbi:Maf family nucleotide pyrophosphatase [Dyadobacter fanqingshengii]|uniref:dTTP/UTP pyrophosphatase n=1 Tax=Dyadobacter fanqingshengii TaxID=2906443 RepID=A0A9X1T8J9_9BACT|nr:Maf family nucleotide pyrophosphatase [Dyadobacter fanqingshengii]MCF0040265.1 Maf family nucleotide pyrophosphatase [Dyadobacter fanqingshengii]USJ37987.1 Maf family nucleotide pyrophosphatase [Dyadobacter fanqingshengii]